MPDEKDHFSQIAEQQNGEVGNLLNRLAEMGIGRSLYAEKINTDFSKDAAARLGVTASENLERIKIGHALPVNKEGTAHVIIFESGEMCYISVPKDSPFIQLYSNFFSEEASEPLPNYLLSQTNHSTADLFRQYAVINNLPVGTYVDGRTPETYQKVKSYFDQALINAQRRKEEIEQTKIQMRDDIIKGLKGVLDPPAHPLPPPPTKPPSAT